MAGAWALRLWGGVRLGEQGQRAETPAGLSVAAVVDTNAYPTKRTVSDAELQALHLVRDSFHGEWNYALHPQ
jgi:hypothetical protein